MVRGGGIMKLSLRRFVSEIDTKRPFDCGDADLNDFLVDTSSCTPNATMYAKELLATTYVLEDKESERNLAYFSILNDKVDREYTDPTIWNSLSRMIPNAKRRSAYPALKIGRLAVCVEMKGLDLGSHILRFIEKLFAFQPIAGCRFITVDAYNSAVGFYQKCNFKCLEQQGPDDSTRLMYFDLKRITPHP